MRAPICILENETGELLIFKSAQAAEQYIEAIDVEDGIYGAAYDAEGCLLNLVITESPTTTFGRWTLQPAESMPTRVDELRERLIKELGRVREPADWLQSASLEELLTRGIERHQTR